jgi:peptidyl-prolyl cis-trans isomerase D
MFEFVRQHNRILQFVLVLLIFPSFVFFGIEGYSKFNEAHSEVAEVNGAAITQAELDHAHRNQVERMREQMPGMDLKLIDTPEMKQRVLDMLVRERVLFEAAHSFNLTPGDERLQRMFHTDPQFSGIRNEDGTVRKEWLASQGLSSEQFVARLRQDLAQRQVTQAISDSGVAGQVVASAALDAFFQRREVEVMRFDPKAFRAKVGADDAELKAFYEAPENAQAFMTAEQARIEMLVLDLDAVQRDLKVSNDDLRAYYDQNITRYTQAEERRARHILIKAEADAAADAKAKARTRAEALLQEIRKNRASFAEVARKSSEDPGSARQGGDLDWFGLGMMAKPFEQAAFALKKGELSGVVETEFGFHLIEITDQRGGERRSFEAVRNEIEGEVRRQLAQKRFADVAEQFSNAVEQEDGLKAVADRLKLELKVVDHVTRQPAPGAAGPLAQPKVIEAIFSPDSLKSRRNSNAIDVGVNQLASVHVLDYQPARRQPLDEVREAVREQLLTRKATQEVRRAGAERLKVCQTGPSCDFSGTAATLSRAQQPGKPATQPRELTDAVLRLAATQFPAWTGVETADGGYAVVKVIKVLPADPELMGSPQAAQRQYARLWAQAETDAYLAALRERFKVKVNGPAAKPAEATASR